VVNDDHPDLDDVDAQRGDVEELRQERDLLAARVAALETRRVRRWRLRRRVAALLVAMGTVAFTLSALGWWARRNVADTEVWLERTGPLAEEPAVQAALGRWLSGEIIVLVDPEELFVEVLPERGRVLAAPLSGAVEGFVRDRVENFLASDRFAQLWLAANERAHRAVVRVLRGDSELVQASGDTVSIDLVPALNAALADIGSASPELLGRQVDLPELTVDDLPDAALQRLEQALDVDLDDGFGQIVVYDRGRLGALQDAVDQARRLLIGVSVLTVVTLAGALWLSDQRRRTLLQMLASLAIGLTAIRRLGIRGQSELLASMPDEVNRAAAEAVTDRFLDPLLAVTQTLLVVLAVVAAVTLVSGPYRWAVALRTRAAQLARQVADGVRRAGPQGRVAGPGVEWLQEHRSALQIGGVAIAVAVLLLVDLSFVGLAALGLLLVGGEVLLSRIPVDVDAA
jgi:hypothetical protein